jgi:hypothetical protein
MIEMYRVKLPFKSVSGDAIAPPVRLPHGMRITHDGDRYVAEVSLDAPTAQDALVAARALLIDFLGCMAVREFAFAELGNSACDVQLVDPTPILDGPPPPFQVIGGGITEKGAEFFDPTGVLRRSRRVMNMWAEATLTRNDLTTEAGWLAVRDRWPERVRRALALRLAGECAGDSSVTLALNYAALEVLFWNEPVKLLKLRLPEKPRRALVVAALREALLAIGLSAGDAGRVVDSARQTHATSPLDSYTSYLSQFGISVERDEIEWVRGQRSAYIHAGEVHTDDGRRDAFRKVIGRVLEAELGSLIGSS